MIKMRGVSRSKKRSGGRAHRLAALTLVRNARANPRSSDAGERRMALTEEAVR